MRLILIFSCLFSPTLFAQDTLLLKLISTDIYKNCEIYKDKVVVEKKAGSIKYSKTTQFKIEPKITDMIERAFVKQPSLRTENGYIGYRYSVNPETMKPQMMSFTLDVNDSDEAYLLVNFVTKICNE